MRERRPIRFERDRAHRRWRRSTTRPRRRTVATPDLVEEILGDLGWRRVDRLASRLRVVFLAAAIVVIGSVALQAADRFASMRDAGGLDEAIRRFGEVPVSLQQAGWAEWMGGIDREPSDSEPADRPDEWNGLIAAAPWSPV
jgi:hypothetical protein